MYLVRIVRRDGNEWYLSRGKLVGDRNATIYPHPSAARVAAERYAKRWPDWYLVWDVIDSRDPERHVN